MAIDDGRDGGYVSAGGVLALSGAALQEFLAAVLERTVPFRFTARGYSMHPFIRDADVITVSPLGGRAPRVGGHDGDAFGRSADVTQDQRQNTLSDAAETDEDDLARKFHMHFAAAHNLFPIFLTSLLR